MSWFDVFVLWFFLQLMNEAVHGGSQMNSLTSQYRGEGSGSAFIRGTVMRKVLRLLLVLV